MFQSDATSDRAQDEARALELEANLLDQSLGNGRLVAVLHVVVLSMLVAVLHQSHPNALLWVWLGAALVYAGLRVWHTVYGERALSRARDAATVTRVRRSLVGVTCFGGILVAAPMLWLAGVLSEKELAIYLIAITGFAASSVSTLAACRPALRTYLITLLSLVLVSQVAAGFGRLNVAHVALSLFIAIYFLVLFVAGSKTNKQFRQLYALDAERTSLLAQLGQANDQLRDERDEFEAQASIDSLTKLANRRSFDTRLEAEWRRCLRERQPLSLALIDIDFFKPYNDSLGHAAGDRCLRRVGRVLAACVRRPGDLAARYGGEEFVLVLAGTDADGAVRVGERLHSTLAEAGIAHGSSPLGPNVTFSVGLASLVPSSETSSRQLLKAADLAVYAAKDAGRNRSCVATAHTYEEAQRAVEASDGEWTVFGQASTAA